MGVERGMGIWGEMVIWGGEGNLGGDGEGEMGEMGIWVVERGIWEEMGMWVVETDVEGHREGDLGGGDLCLFHQARRVLGESGGGISIAGEPACCSVSMFFSRPFKSMKNYKIYYNLGFSLNYLVKYLCNGNF